MNLENKVAFITGAKNGIGRAVAETFLVYGAKVVATDIDIEGLSFDEFNNSENYLILKTDVTNQEEVNYAMNQAKNKFGKIDILVANAGINSRNDLFGLNLTDFHQILDVNLKGTVMCCQEVAKVMKEQFDGSIIIMSSISSDTVVQPNIALYGASKGANLSFSKHLAVELSKYNIRVNAISPGSIKTEMTKERLNDEEKVKENISKIPLNRLGYPEDIAGAAAFLASDLSKFITGANLVIDGGESII